MRGESATTRYRPFVCEDEVGITEFSTPDLGGVGGRLKLLPPDFIVEELHQPPAQQPQVQRSGSWSTRGEPEAEPLFLEFTLHKTRLGTLEATKELAAELGVPPATFQVAGLKDSHALTTQRISCRRTLVAHAAASGPDSRSGLDEEQIRRAVDSLPRMAVEVRF